MIGNDYSEASYFFKRHVIPHYYGDNVRTLFIVVAVISVLIIPIFGNLLSFGTVGQLGAAILLVLLAGLTNPHSKMLMLADVVVAGAGVLLLGSAGISFYSLDPFILFAVREAGAVTLLFAFYFSVKTLRAMIQGKTGQTERPWEFDNPKGSAE